MAISGYISGVGAAAARLPQCQKAMSSGVKTLFNGIGDFLGGETGGEFDIEAKGLQTIPIPSKPTLSGVENLDTKASDFSIQTALPNVSNPLSEKELKELNKKMQELLGVSKAINENSSCIQSIGRLIIKTLLQKMTVSTINWINSGFEGSPAFLQNPGKFFGDIAKNEVLQFGIEIDGISPFSKDWIRNNALSFNNKFQQNARYSLDELIQQTNPDYDAVTFGQDFSMGGWDAWSAMTQIPANNPLGFKLMADNEIQKRLTGTAQSNAENIRDALQQANGFLGDQRCVEPYGITREQDIEARNAIGAKADEDGYIPGTCKEWEYVTPGKLISEAATTAINYQNNAYLNVEDLNDAVAAISDALLAQFSSNIMENGFANMGNEGSDGTLYFNSNMNDSYRTQTEKDYIPSQLSSSWLQANPDFNIRTDFTQALIDEQRTYIDKLALQNKELLSTTDGKEYKLSADGKSSNAYGLMPAIYQLDYCIPGPHPGWEDDSRETLRRLVLPQEKIEANETGEIVNGVVGAGLNFVPYVGPVLSSLFGMLTGDDAVERASTDIRQMYTNQFFKLTGYLPQAVYGNHNSKDMDVVNSYMANAEGFFYVINSIFDKYIKIMNKTYFSSPSLLPEITKEAAGEFEKLSGYNQIIKNNNNKILSMKTTINILEEIKDAVEKLNTQLEVGQDSEGNLFTETDYEEALKFQINTFGRLSASMVNGDDIASADDLAKQIVTKKNFIYKNLLKGPYGCEAFLQNKANIKSFPSAGSLVAFKNNDWNNYDINSVQRMTYPFPIIYDYNSLSKGSTIPDPWKSGYNVSEIPKMPTENQYDKYGPGFLSFVNFSSTFDSNGKRIHDFNGAERLDLTYLVNNHNPGFEDGRLEFEWVSLGKSLIKPGVTWRGDGFFEKTIGIY